MVEKRAPASPELPGKPHSGTRSGRGAMGEPEVLAGPRRGPEMRSGRTGSDGTPPEGTGSGTGEPLWGLRSPTAGPEGLAGEVGASTRVSGLPSGFWGLPAALRGLLHLLQVPQGVRGHPETFGLPLRGLWGSRRSRGGTSGGVLAPAWTFRRPHGVLGGAPGGCPTPPSPVPVLPVPDDEGLGQPPVEAGAPGDAEGGGGDPGHPQLLGGVRAI